MRKRGPKAAARDAAMEGGTWEGHEAGREDGKVEGIAEVRRRRFARPAAVLQLVRKAVEGMAGKAG